MSKPFQLKDYVQGKKYIGAFIKINIENNFKFSSEFHWLDVCGVFFLF